MLRDSYAHDTPNPYPGGAGYLLSLAEYTADSLVENNIFINGNKVMVMRASGGGNVIGYNYFDNGYIGNYLGWMETGLNAVPPDLSRTSSCSRGTRPSTSTATTPGAAPSTTRSSATTRPASGGRTPTSAAGAPSA